MFGNYNMGAVPQMQQRLNNLQQMYGTPQQMQSPYNGLPTFQQQSSPYIKGRLVSGVEEARASQIDLDGSSTFFPSPAEGKIYEKLIDLNGLPVFRVYELVKTPTVPTDAQNSDTVKDLQERVSQLEKTIQDLQGVIKNERNADFTNASREYQSNVTTATVNGEQSYNAKSVANGTRKRNEPTSGNS